MISLNEYIQRYADRGSVRFHTPGHKGVLDARDITELNIAGQPRFEDVLTAAERRTAKLYGAKYCHYIVNGATGGLLTVLRALPKGRIIIARASHKAVFNGCILNGIEPVIIEKLDRDGIDSPINAAQIERAVKANPDVVAAVITSPNYYGQVTDLAAIKEALGGRYLIVDSAHGAHCGFYESLPYNATAYADACVLSAHKTLPAYTQSAYLNVNDDQLEVQVRAAINMYGSTSPSYLLLAGLEYAAEYTHKHADKAYSEIESAVAKYLDMRVANDDFTRIVIDLKEYNISGYEADKLLQTKYNVFCEFANCRFVVFILSIMDNEQVVKVLSEAVKGMLNQVGRRVADDGSCDTECNNYFTPSRAQSFLETGYTDVEYVPLEESEGRICAIEAGLFPPCLPLIVRGEIITRDVIDSLSGKNVFGLSEGRIRVVK